MISVRVITGAKGDVMVGSVKTAKFNVPFDKKIYDQLMVINGKAKKAETVEEYNAFMEEATTILTSDRKSEIETACSDIVEIKGKYFIKADVEGRTVISKHAIPSSFVMKITEAIEKGIDASPLVKAWIRFMRNPNFSDRKAELFCKYVTATIVDREDKLRFIEEGFSQDMAEEMATYNDVAVTDEGLICCYKYAQLKDTKYQINPETNKVELVKRFEEEIVGVDEETGKKEVKVKYPEFADSADMVYFPPIMGNGGDDFFCDESKGHIMKVGATIQLEDWAQVNCNDSTSGRPGLHVGGRAYVNGYSGRFNHLLECFVSPEDMGAFVDLERGDGAIRCKRYFVYGAADKATKNLFHSSKYAEMLDEEWAEYKLEAIKEAEAKVQDAKDLI